MSKLNSWFVTLTLAFVALLAVWFISSIGCLIWTVVHYPPIAKEMADSIHERYPQLDVKGTTGVETMHINVSGDADEKSRREIRELIFENMHRMGIRMPLALEFQSQPREYFWLDDWTKNEWRPVPMT